MGAPRTMATKEEVRRRMRRVLQGLPEAGLAAQTSSATQALLTMPEYNAARRIGVYLSMPAGEVSTSYIVRDALDRNKKVFIPYTHILDSTREGQPRSIMDMVELQSAQDLETLLPDKWGIPTPSIHSIPSRLNCFGGQGVVQEEEEEASAGLDVLVMPGMAFDSDFGRLGHGKGFYDYFLARCLQRSRMPFRVGLSLLEQFLPSGELVPMDASDFRLDALITGDGRIRRAQVI